ncbi:MAG: VOC family protein [Armatimonadetes bacterium]|nr:VOC family protein [Armatimonadota bacterium]
MPEDTPELICGLHHCAVSAADYEASARFYTEILGGRMVAAWNIGNRQLCLIDVGEGSHIEILGASGDDPQRPPLAHTALRVTDVDRALERVRAAGYQVTIEPRDVQLGNSSARIAFCIGPNGEVLEFFQERS